MESQSVLATTCGELELRWGERTYVMGILNVTPDSFSGDGLADDFKAAVKRARPPDPTPRPYRLKKSCGALSPSSKGWPASFPCP
jgi:hypothetical protein